MGVIIEIITVALFFLMGQKISDISEDDRKFDLTLFDFNQEEIKMNKVQDRIKGLVFFIPSLGGMVND